MKYGESLFDIVYILLAIIMGIKILLSKSKSSKLMGSSVLILGLGDAFHLIPRILNYFINYDFNMYLGIGKLVTSITMTIFYIFMYYIYLKVYNNKENKNVTFIIFFMSLPLLQLSIIRIILCLFPQNK